MATWNRNSQEFHPFDFGPDDMEEMSSVEHGFPRALSMDAFQCNDLALAARIPLPMEWPELESSPSPQPQPPTFSYVPSPPPRPMPHGALAVPPPPPPQEWMEAEDMEMQSSVDEEDGDDEIAMEGREGVHHDDEDEPEQPGNGMPAVTWTNVVATVNMGCTIPLKELMDKAQGVEWRPSKFPAVVMRRSDPKATCLIFASGKCVVTGPQSVSQSRAACRRFVAAVRSLGYPARWAGYSVVNLSAMFECPFGVRLSSLATSLGSQCKYDAARYPGLTYRIAQPQAKATLTVFATGKVVLVGCASSAAAVAAASIVFPLLVPHATEMAASKKKRAPRR